MTIFIDGDFDSGKGNCKFHCSPSCHPAQTDPDNWKYGCRHIAWPQNKARDFVPIVERNGNKNKCELSNKTFFKNYKRGLNVRLSNSIKKVDKLKQELRYMENFKELSNEKNQS